MGIEGTVKTPFGAMQKKTAVIAGGGGVLLIGIVWYRSKQASANAPAASATTAATDPTIDPSTGLPYAQEGQQDSSSFTGGQVIGYDGGGNPIYGPVGGGVGGGAGSGNTGPGTFTSNASWAQYVEDWMVNTEGANAATVGNAIGKYLAGAELTPDMVAIVQSAIAIGNAPPVPGALGYPPGIRQAGGGGGTGSGNAHNPVAHLKATDTKFDNVTVAWAASQNAKSYNVKATEGSKVVSQTTVTGTSATIRGLKQKTSYRVSVWASPSSGSSRATITVRTK